MCWFDTKFCLQLHDLLFTMDVSALYFNIPDEDGIRATLKLLEAHQDDIDT